MIEWLNQNAGLAIGIVLALINIVGWVWTNFNKAYKARRTVDGYVEKIDNHTKRIDEMDIRHQEDYLKLDSKLDGLSNVLNNYIDMSKRSNQAILRDKIYSIYKDMLKKGYILEKDSRNIHDMIDSYKEFGGNSYVCDEIVPRMGDFKVFISDEDADGFFKRKVNE
jgi:uncharacterized FlgJ-related protein